MYLEEHVVFIHFNQLRTGYPSWERNTLCASAMNCFMCALQLHSPLLHYSRLWMQSVQKTPHTTASRNMCYMSSLDVTTAHVAALLKRKCGYKTQTELLVCSRIVLTWEYYFFKKNKCNIVPNISNIKFSDKNTLFILSGYPCLTTGANNKYV